MAKRDYEVIYESVLAEILAGREVTAEVAQQVQQGAAYGRDLREFADAVQNADTSKPGWISRLLGGG